MRLTMAQCDYHYNAFETPIYRRSPLGRKGRAVQIALGLALVVSFIGLVGCSSNEGSSNKNEDSPGVGFYNRENQFKSATGCDFVEVTTAGVLAAYIVKCPFSTVDRHGWPVLNEANATDRQLADLKSYLELFLDTARNSLNKSADATFRREVKLKIESAESALKSVSVEVEARNKKKAEEEEKRRKEEEKRRKEEEARKKLERDQAEYRQRNQARMDELTHMLASAKSNLESKGCRFAIDSSNCIVTTSVEDFEDVFKGLNTQIDRGEELFRHLISSGLDIRDVSKEVTATRYALSSLEMGQDLRVKATSDLGLDVDPWIFKTDDKSGVRALLDVLLIRPDLRFYKFADGKEYEIKTLLSKSLLECDQLSPKDLSVVIYNGVLAICTNNPRAALSGTQKFGPAHATIALERLKDRIQATVSFSQIESFLSRMAQVRSGTQWDVACDGRLRVNYLKDTKVLESCLNGLEQAKLKLSKFHNRGLFVVDSKSGAKVFNKGRSVYVQENLTSEAWKQIIKDLKSTENH